MTGNTHPAEAVVQARGVTTILLIEAESSRAASTAETLRMQGHKVLRVSNTGQAMEVLRIARRIDLVLVDLCRCGSRNALETMADVLNETGVPLVLTSLDRLVARRPPRLAVPIGGAGSRLSCGDEARVAVAGELSQLRRRVAEHDVLMRDATHRMKNDFALLESLLSYAMGRTDQVDPQTVLQDAVGRVMAMRTLYEQLLRIGGDAGVDAGAYLREILSTVVDAHSSETKVRPVVLVEETILSPRQTLYLGLIAHELTTNSMKHAYAQSRSTEGTIGLSLFRRGDRVRLTISDDGSGMHHRTPDGVGTTLVRAFCKQLDATLRTEVNGGTRHSLEFVVADARTKVA